MFLGNGYVFYLIETWVLIKNLEMNQTERKGF